MRPPDRRCAAGLPALTLALSLLLPAQGHAGSLILSSPDIQDGATVPDAEVLDRAGCSGRNISPALQWRGAPAATRSFAVTVYDPDAPTASGWWHWIIFDIPPGSTGLAADAGTASAGLAPAGSVQLRNDFGFVGWGGPCPPQGGGAHHYIFTVYALDVGHLPADPGSSPSRAAAAIRAHALGQGSLTAVYERQ